MILQTRRPASAHLSIELRFAFLLALASSLGYGLVIFAATQRNNPNMQFLWAIGPVVSLWLCVGGFYLLQALQKPINLLHGILGWLLGGSLGVGITHWLTGIELTIALQATGIAGGVAGIIGMRFCAKAAVATAILGGLCAAAGQVCFPLCSRRGLGWRGWSIWLVRHGRPAGWGMRLPKPVRSRILWRLGIYGRGLVPQR